MRKKALQVLWYRISERNWILILLWRISLEHLLSSKRVETDKMATAINFHIDSLDFSVPYIIPLSTMKFFPLCVRKRILIVFCHDWENLMSLSWWQPSKLFSNFLLSNILRVHRRHLNYSIIFSILAISLYFIFP